MSNMTSHTNLNLLDTTAEQVGDEEKFISNRANMSVFIEYPDYGDDDEETKVVLQLDAAYGQPVRWIEMSDDEARQLAKILFDHAQQVTLGTFSREPEDA